MHFRLSDALHHQQWLHLSVHIQMAPQRTELLTHWVDFLTSWYCQFISGILNNHPLQQRRSAKYNPVKWWAHEHRTAFNSSLSFNYPHFNLHTGNTDKVWKSRFWQTLAPPREVVEASPCLPGQSQLPENPQRTSFGYGYLNGHIHPPHSWELPSTIPLPKYLPILSNSSLSNKIMENLVCLYD